MRHSLWCTVLFLPCNVRLGRWICKLKLAPLFIQQARNSLRQWGCAREGAPDRQMEVVLLLFPGVFGLVFVDGESDVEENSHSRLLFVSLELLLVVVMLLNLVILHTILQPSFLVFQVEAEEQPEISESYCVSAVPFFVFFKDGEQVDKLEGADPSSLANKVSKIAGSLNRDETAAPASLGMAAGPTILETVKEFSKSNGEAKAQATPENDLNKRVWFQPESCVDILKNEKVDFRSFDILSDQEVREGLKKFSNWPTYPQLYCKGELLDGSDIAIAMHESGEPSEVFRDHGIETIDAKGKAVEAAGGMGGVSESSGLSSSLTSRLEGLVNSTPVILFMKGKPEEPKCGFRRKVVDVLRQENVELQTFGILADEKVRQGLKVYSNWSSYPQLYIKGELIGGSDIVLEMQKSGELKKTLIEKGIIKESLEDRLKKLVESSPVMLFMKRSPDAPRCGFSSKVVNALSEEGMSFGSFDILSDQEVREGLKKFSNWPTYPHLYYKGELISGCDVILELKSNGELKSTLSE
ncbi:Monothiol glutaredoxin-S17-like protein [Drosera capensis]